MDQNVSIGTGGVTEGFKNRVFMPYFESNRQTDHVLGHELVQAFQYNLLKTGGDSLSFYNIGNLTLRMLEGIAANLSLGRNEAHKALWMRDAVLSSYFHSERKIPTNKTYFHYSVCHDYWSVVAVV